MSASLRATEPRSDDPAAFLRGIDALLPGSEIMLPRWKDLG